MYLTGVSLSLLSVGALDFGIIVDATIVMVERVLHRLTERAGPLRSMSAPARGRAAAPIHGRPGPRPAPRARGPASGALLAPHHHRSVHSAFDARARRAPALHADGADRLLRAARRLAPEPHVRPGAGHAGLPERCAVSPEPRPRVGPRGLRPRPPPGPSNARADRARRRDPRRGRHAPRRTARHRGPPPARRGSPLDPESATL